jgi:LPXTG-motif cell wall-anchored protein
MGRVLAGVGLKPPPRRAAVLLATAALPLPLHHPGAAARAHLHHHHQRHRHGHRANTTTPSHGRHRHQEFELRALVATPTARDAAATRAHAAGDPADTISDFQFAPATVTVHVGDTITWTNQGPSPHSATANNHSFDTGVLRPGQSASHTFAQAGTFTYFCTVHPFMHGTVVVVANQTSTSTSGSNGAAGSSSTTGANSGSGTSGSGSSATTSPATGTAVAATPSTGTLPLTGMDTAGAVLIGLILLGSGAVIRRRVRSSH